MDELKRHHKAGEGREGRRRNCRRSYDSSNGKRQEVNSLLLLLLFSSSSSPLCSVFILIFLRQNMSLGNTVLQLFCCYYSWCLYR